MASNLDLSRPPYLDRFNPNNNRTKVLFRPNRPLQQAELNELQSIAEHNIKRLGDSIFVDGAMQTGMAFSINEEEGTLTVADGLIYLEGKVRKFNEQTVPFTGEGIEKIGVKLEKRIITYEDDPGLLDQTIGADSYLSRGADRLEEVIRLTINDDSAPTIYEFRDGKLFLDPNVPNYSVLDNILAERTFEESGSYQVEGFKMWVEPGNDDEHVNLVVDRGVAYVLGYRINKPTATRIPVKKSKDFSTVIRETHYYDPGNPVITIGSDSVKRVSRVIARSETPPNGIILSKGAEDGRDIIPSEYAGIDRNTPVLWTENPAVTYRYGQDYTIVEIDGIQYVDWDTGVGGNEPATGTSYHLSFEYDRRAVEGLDYVINIKEPEDENEHGWVTEIDFGSVSGTKPKPNGLISVDYEFYLAREDLITLNSLGEFTVIEGQSGREEFVRAPLHTDPLTLEIGTVLLYPNSDKAVAHNTAVTRLRMEDLQRMKSRLEDVEYNQVLQQLESQAIGREDPVLLRGVYADAFVDFSRMDPNDSDVAINFQEAAITLRKVAEGNNVRRPEIDYERSTAVKWKTIITAPFREVPEIHQPLASDSLNVNPYAVYNKMGVLTLTPSRDIWIDQENVTVNESQTVHASRTETVQGENFHRRNDRWWRERRETTVSEEVDTTTSISQRIRSENTIEYMRPIDVEFRAENLLPGADNLYLTFDGVRVPVQPTGQTTAGASAGTVRANQDGVATGRFTIPEGIRTGVREVVLRNDTNVAATTFTAEGTHRVVEDVVTRVTTITRVETVRISGVYVDPLAQSFTLPYDRVLTSVDLYFATKSQDDNVIVQIRGLTDSGFPNNEIYAEKLLTPNDVLISDDASVATNVRFDEPFLCKANKSYSIVIMTDSNEYTMWIGTVGGDVVGTENQSITANPYTEGVLFSSSNAQTWTEHQESDLKFTLYSAEFEEEGYVEFETIDEIDSDTVLLLANVLTPDNTGCAWEIKTVALEDVDIVDIDNVAWEPITSNLELSVSPIIGKVKLRARFRSTPHMSPMMTEDDLLLVNYITGTEGQYVTRNIDASDAPFNAITVTYDADIPQGASVTPYYSLDGGWTWKPFTNPPRTSRVSARFVRYHFTERVSEQATNDQIKFKLHFETAVRVLRPYVRRFTALFKEEIQ